MPSFLQAEAIIFFYAQMLAAFRAFNILLKVLTHTKKRLDIQTKTDDYDGVIYIFFLVFEAGHQITAVQMRTVFRTST